MHTIYENNMCSYAYLKYSVCHLNIAVNMESGDMHRQYSEANLFTLKTFTSLTNIYYSANFIMTLSLDNITTMLWNGTSTSFGLEGSSDYLEELKVILSPDHLCGSENHLSNRGHIWMRRKFRQHSCFNKVRHRIQLHIHEQNNKPSDTQSISPVEKAQGVVIFIASNITITWHECLTLKMKIKMRRLNAAQNRYRMTPRVLDTAV